MSGLPWHLLAVGYNTVRSKPPMQHSGLLLPYLKGEDYVFVYFKSTVEVRAGSESF